MPSMKHSYRDIHGILLLDKPQGLSSNQALQKARRLFGASKAGHTGSLDPLATGLLPVCFGEATKIAGYLLGASKAYRARVVLGVTTNTDDAEGEVLQKRAVPPLDIAAIEQALAPLRGRIVQVPPAYSAIKQGGVPLYKRARRGEEVTVPAREVDVHSLQLVELGDSDLVLDVECGSGTYVRSLARDLGERLGCGAHLSALRRLWVEPFRAPRMYTLDELQKLREDGGEPALQALLLPLEEGLQGLPGIQVSPEQAQQLQQGKRWCQDGLRAVDLARALDDGQRLVALVRIDAAGEVAVVRGFNR